MGLEYVKSQPRVCLVSHRAATELLDLLSKLSVSAGFSVLQVVVLEAQLLLVAGFSTGVFTWQLASPDQEDT